MKKHSKKLLNAFLNKVFIAFGSNSKYQPQQFKNLLITAAHGNDFIETVSSVLHNINADTLFWRLENFTYVENIIEAFNVVLEKTLKRVKALSRNRTFTLAIDTTQEPYYGKKSDFWIHGYKPEKGCTGSFEFVELSIVQGDKRFVLHAMPVYVGWNKAKTVLKLLNIANKYVKIKEVLLDRAFYSAEIIDAISKLYKYIILVPQKEFIKCMLESVEGYAVVEHELKLNRNFTTKKVKTNLVLIKGEGGDYDWCFATNLYLRNVNKYILYYKQRWGIETTNRCMDEVHIRTKSSNIIVRTFLFVFSCLLYNLWIWLKLEGFNITLRRLSYALFFLLVLDIPYSLPT